MNKNIQQNTKKTNQTNRPIRTIVAKFGGTSVKTPEAIRQVAQILASNKNIRFVVVSACGGITNKLVEYCNAAPQTRLQLAAEIEAFHLKIAHELGLVGSSENTNNKIESKIKNKLQLLYANVDASEFSLEQTDQLITLGEDLSSMIIYEFLHSKKMAITLLDARKFMITDDQFGKASPDIAAIKTNLELACSQIPPEHLIITQGFVGSTQDNRTTTLGRGGSDYSAALIAEAINASELYIYTDVPGVFTMDPNIVEAAHPIANISFQEMAEMANFGAKILHPATLAPCLRAQVPVIILSTFEPEKSGTYVAVTDEQTTKNQPLVHAITMRKAQVLVTIKSLNMLNAYGFLANIFTILAKYKISVDLITTSEVSVALTIDGTSFGSHGINPFTNPHLMAELEHFAEVIIEEELTLIAVIGTGLTIPGMVQNILAKLDNQRVRLICYGASNSSVGILVRREDAELIAQLLHHKLLENEDRKSC